LSQGTQRILDVVPQTLADHVSTLLGSYDDITEIEKYLKKHAEK